MAYNDNLVTKKKISDAGLTAREIDLASQFSTDLTALMNVLGISKAIKKEPGSRLVMKKVSVELEDSVAEGEIIPYSEVTFDEVSPTDITLEKYSVGVSMEAINQYGYDVAVDKADQGMISAIRSKTIKAFYGVLEDGTLTSKATGIQAQLAKAMAQVLTHFEAISLGVSGVAGFVNTSDFYTYLGGADLTVQTAFGMQYVKNFLGYDVIFLTSQITSGTVVATPTNNLFVYSIDPANGDFTKAGLVFTTDESGLIGIHINGNYGVAVSETFAVCGVVLWPEYADGIAVVTTP